MIEMEKIDLKKAACVMSMLTSIFFAQIAYANVDAGEFADIQAEKADELENDQIKEELDSGVLSNSEVENIQAAYRYMWDDQKREMKLTKENVKELYKELVDFSSSNGLTPQEKKMIGTYIQYVESAAKKMNVNLSSPAISPNVANSPGVTVIKAPEPNSDPKTPDNYYYGSEREGTGPNPDYRDASLNENNPKSKKDSSSAESSSGREIVETKDGYLIKKNDDDSEAVNEVARNYYDGSKALVVVPSNDQTAPTSNDSSKSSDSKNNLNASAAQNQKPSINANEGKNIVSDFFGMLYSAFSQLFPKNDAKTHSPVGISSKGSDSSKSDNSNNKNRNTETTGNAGNTDSGAKNNKSERSSHKNKVPKRKIIETKGGYRVGYEPAPAYNSGNMKSPAEKNVSTSSSGSSVEKSTQQTINIIDFSRSSEALSE